MNLVDNAIKYTNKGEVAVKIKYNSFEGNMEITVQDTGEGMTQEEIDKLFQSFSRTESGRKNWSEGSGLGLYVAKKFIEMLTSEGEEMLGSTDRSAPWQNPRRVTWQRPRQPVYH